MTGPWQVVETFGGDRSYESPVLTFDGAVTIYLNPEDAEGAALTLRVASDLREAASVHLTIEEADALTRWLRQAIDDLDDARRATR